MEKLLVFVLAITINTHSFAMGLSGSKDYTLIIIDVNDNLIINKEVIVIVDRDTLRLITNLEGQITIPINYSYRCQSGKKFRRLRKKRTPDYHADLITIICETSKGSFSKNWRKYFKKSNEMPPDRYEYINGELTK